MQFEVREKLLPGLFSELLLLEPDAPLWGLSAARHDLATSLPVHSCQRRSDLSWQSSGAVVEGREGRTDPLAGPQAVSEALSSWRRALEANERVKPTEKVRCCFLEPLGLRDLSVSGAGLRSSSTSFSS